MAYINIKKALEELDLDTASVSDPEINRMLTGLLNIIESAHHEVEALQKENQQLKDEINRLKGEQGKPDIKSNSRKKNTNHSSEDERKNGNGKDTTGQDGKKKRKRKPKLPNIKIDREQLCPVDKSILPEDAISKGHTPVVIQDIKITTDNVRYLREIYYSPSEKKTYLGELPSNIAGKGEYGVGVRSLIPLLKSECNMSESCILDFFQNFGIEISSATISNLWTKGYQEFHQEQSDIFQAGLSSSIFQQMDDTGARVCGQNHYTQIICSPLYSAYFTTERKDRLTVLDVLRGFAPREFLYNDHAVSLLEGFKLSMAIRNALDQTLKRETLYSETCFDSLIDNLNPGPQQRARIHEACAIAAYREQTLPAPVKILMVDDAPQFKLLTESLILCWIHDGRHYKKLCPVVPDHQKYLDDFLTQYWLFYHQLKDYKKEPDPNKISQLEEAFDKLFSTRTGYDDLDKRIAKTLAKHDQLLLVLKYPELPLHNNASELAARVQARSRDVSFHTMSKKGTKAKDVFMTISQTAKKLKVRTYEYIRDRVSGEYKMPSLAQLIIEKAGSSCDAELSDP